MNNPRSARVVVGVGGSLAAFQALRYAVAEARRRATPLLVVRVWENQAALPGQLADGLRGDAAADAAAIIRDSFDRAMGDMPRDIELELIVVEGATAPALVAQAFRDDDVLVVGATRRRWWRLGLGAVDRYCARKAGCPVVVVPAPALERQYGTRALRRAIRRDARRLPLTGAANRREPKA